jgi:hypothetical protein
VKRPLDLFRSHPAALNAAGNGLVSFDEEKLVLELCGDWQARADRLSASDFLNIAIGIEAIDGRHARRRVRDQGLGCIPSDQRAVFISRSVLSRSRRGRGRAGGALARTNLSGSALKVS